MAIVTKEKRREYNLTYREKHPDRVKEQSRKAKSKMTEEQREAKRASWRAWAVANPEKVKARNKKYNAMYKDKPLSTNSLKSKERHRNAYRDQWLEILKNHLGGKFECQKCGYDEYFAAMDLHHINPKTKIYKNTFSRNYRCAPTPVRVKRVLDEVDKCELLCRNCHSVHHYLNGRDN